MKGKILTLIIGILIGAAVTAGIFLLFNKNNEKSINREEKSVTRQMKEENPGENGNMEQGENSNGKGGKNRNKEKTENTTESNNTQLPETSNTSTT